MVNQISAQEIAKHRTQEDCWVIIHGKVYDLTKFLPEHPGGIKVITRWAGQDATSAFEPVHPPDIIERYLPPEYCLGEVNKATITATAKVDSEEDKRLRVAHEKKPALDEILNVFDFEGVAKQVLKPDAWAYYSSGADDEITLRENHNVFHRLWLRPRVMVNVTNIDMNTTFLGARTSFPVYITATALGKLGHPEGEVVLTRAAASEDIIQMCPTLASCSLDEMVAARQEGQTQWFQLYVNKDRRVTERLVKNAEAKGVKALFITVDAPQLGRREKDMRMKYEIAPPDEIKKNKEKVDRQRGAAKAITGFIDPGLNWSDVAWFQSITCLPIILKGVQTVEDAILAARHGCQGVVLSNHGGRQLDFAPSGVEILSDVVDALRVQGLDENFEVYVDGGIRRGTDIFKALALGAKGVGIGRPALYAMSAYGQAGVERMLELLKDELEMCMRLMGTPSLKDIKREMVDTRNLKDHIAVVPADHTTKSVYEKMRAKTAKL